MEQPRTTMEEGEAVVKKDQIIVINCRQVWKELSNYIDGQLDPVLRSRIEAHVKDCDHCSAVLDGMSNVVRLVCDDQVIQVPQGFSERLRQRILTVAKN